MMASHDLRFRDSTGQMTGLGQEERFPLQKVGWPKRSRKPTFGRLVYEVRPRRAPRQRGGAREGATGQVWRVNASGRYARPDPTISLDDSPRDLAFSAPGHIGLAVPARVRYERALRSSFSVAV